MGRTTHTSTSNRTTIYFKPKRFRDYIKYVRAEGTKDGDDKPNLSATARDILYFILDIYFSKEMQTIRERDGSSTLEFIKRATILELKKVSKFRQA